MHYWLSLLTSLPDVATLATETPHSERSLSPVSRRHTETETIVAQASTVPTPVRGQLGGANDWLVGGSLIIIVFFVLALTIWAAITKFYVIVPNNEAFVKTGILNKKKKVFLSGGCTLIPGLDEITRVPLREISIDVERTGNLAVRTQDYLRANMRVTFYVCINAQEEDILVAAARISKQGRISEGDIKDALEKRADDAIRAAAKRKSIAEIDSDKLGFADEVVNLIQQDLKKVGLTLNNIAISEIEESDTYDENNFFDAQGVRLRTETIQRSIKQKLDVELTTDREKKELELNTRVALEEQELAAEKRSLLIAKQKEEAKLKQVQEVETLQAQTDRQVQETKDQEVAKVERNKILQQKSIEEERIKQDLALQSSKIDSEIALEERNKLLKVARTQQQQEAEMTEIERRKTIDAANLKSKVAVAQAEQESSIAQKEAAIAIAMKEKERFAAEADRVRAEEEVNTAQEIEKATREQRLAVIEAQQEAEQTKITEQNVVEIEVFRRRRQAEIARQAAELEAESIRTLAEANRYKALADAQGKKALIEAENALSDSNRTAKVIEDLFPEVAPFLPDLIKAIAPQPGILGDTRIFSFPGGDGQGPSSPSEINKLLLSTSGLSLINGLMDEGKLGSLLHQLKDLMTSSGDRPAPSGEKENILQSADTPPEDAATTPDPNPMDDLMDAIAAEDDLADS